MTRDEILNMPAGKEMDALVAERVMGWHYAEQTDPKVHTWLPWRRPDGVARHVPRRYSTDIAAAWDVVEKMQEKGYGVVIHNLPEWYCKLTDEHGEIVSRSGYTDTVSLAICRAVLLAILERNTN